MSYHNQFMSEQKQKYKKKPIAYQEKNQKFDKQELKAILMEKLRQKRIES